MEEMYVCLECEQELGIRGKLCRRYGDGIIKTPCCICLNPKCGCYGVLQEGEQLYPPPPSILQYI